MLCARMRIGNAGQIFGISTVKSRPVSIPVLTHRPSVVADKDIMVVASYSLSLSRTYSATVLYCGPMKPIGVNKPQGDGYQAPISAEIAEITKACVKVTIIGSPKPPSAH